MNNETDKSEGTAILGETMHYHGTECRRLSKADETYNRQFDEGAVQVKPGEACWLDDHAKMLVTQVGSGIALTIFDEQLHFGVLAHCLLPPSILREFPHFGNVSPETSELALRPIEQAIAEMKRHGAGKNRIRIRVFGGATLSGDMNDTGTKTHVFVKSNLLSRKLNIMSEDIGGKHIRRVHFFPETGAATRFLLRRQSDVSELKIEEEKYLKS